MERPKKIEIFKYQRTSNPSIVPQNPKISIKTRPIIAEREISMPSPNHSEVKIDPKSMKEATRFINDVGEVVDSIHDILSNSVNFNVVSAIGPQGSGKSTILSMLAGNNSRHMYREYYFRPTSREANESSKHQTLKIEIYITMHHIFIDCQPIHGVSVLEYVSRSSKFDESAGSYDTLRLLSFLLFVSHTVLVCTESYIDMNLIKTIRTAELIRPYLNNFEPKISLERKTNLVFIHTKAHKSDFAPCVIEEREELLENMFKDSKWLRVSKNNNAKILYPFAELKVRKDQLYEGELNVEEDDDSSLIFDESIAKLRHELLKNRDQFTEVNGAMDEKKWAEMCREVMRDPVMINSLRVYSRLSTDIMR